MKIIYTVYYPENCLLIMGIVVIEKINNKFNNIKKKKFHE